MPKLVKIHYKIFQRIDQLLGDEELDLIVGGPPHQTYSRIGRACCPNRMKPSERISFLREFLREYEPEYFVEMFLVFYPTDEEGDSYLKLIDLFQEYGYETEFETLNAKDYVFPKIGEGLFLLSTGFFPKPSRKLDVLVVARFTLSFREGNVGPCSMAPHYHQWLRDTVYAMKNSQ